MPARNVAGGEEAILRDLEWLGIAWDEGPVRQSDRAERHREVGGAARRPLRRHHAAARGRLADVPARVGRRRHRLRDHAHRPRQRPPPERGGAPAPVRGARRDAAGVRPSRPDPRRRRAQALEAAPALRPSPSCASRASRPRPCARTSRSSALPRHDVHLDLARLRRLSIETLAALSDEELAARVGVPVSVAPVLRGARDLAEARDYAALVLEPGRGGGRLARDARALPRARRGGNRAEGDRAGAEGRRRRPEGAAARAHGTRARPGARCRDRRAPAATSCCGEP